MTAVTSARLEEVTVVIADQIKNTNKLKPPRCPQVRKISQPRLYSRGADGPSSGFMLDCTSTIVSTAT